MTMNKLFFIGLLSIVWFSCTKNEPLLYTAKPAVYFENLRAEADSVVYSFTTTTDLSDTVYISVKLLGSLQENKTFQLVVDESLTTAVAGTHYEPLMENYVFTAGKVTVKVPIYVRYNTDLDDKVVTLAFHLESNEDMDAGYSDRLNGRLLITNQLIKPVYWENPMALYFGAYSKVKHQICTDIMGHDFPLKLEDAQYWDGETIYGYWMRKGREVAEYISNHEVYDENGNRISEWIPF